MASCLSTSPRTASLVVSLIEPSNSSPVLPVAAISAASPIVSLNETPIAAEISFAVFDTSSLTLPNSAAEVPATSPYTLVKRTNS